MTWNAGLSSLVRDFHFCLIGNLILLFLVLHYWLLHYLWQNTFLDVHSTCGEQLIYNDWNGISHNLATVLIIVVRWLSSFTAELIRWMKEKSWKQDLYYFQICFIITIVQYRNEMKTTFRTLISIKIHHLMANSENKIKFTLENRQRSLINSI